MKTILRITAVSLLLSIPAALLASDFRPQHSRSLHPYRTHHSSVSIGHHRGIHTPGSFPHRQHSGRPVARRTTIVVPAFVQPEIYYGTSPSYSSEVVVVPFYKPVPVYSSPGYVIPIEGLRDARSPEQLWRIYGDQAGQLIRQ